MTLKYIAVKWAIDLRQYLNCFTLVMFNLGNWFNKNLNLLIVKIRVCMCARRMGA